MIPHLTTLHMYHTLHGTPTPPLPLPSPSSESTEIERAGGYQFTVTHMPNYFAFGGGNISSHLQMSIVMALSQINCSM